jgi:hypothetical protein
MQIRRAICHLNLLGLLRARRERPCHRSTAECSQQFPPSDGDCHTIKQEQRAGVINQLLNEANQQGGTL